MLRYSPASGKVLLNPLHAGNPFYINHFTEQCNRELQIDRAKMGTVTVQFGIGATTSIGSVEVDTPIGVVEFHIVGSKYTILVMPPRYGLIRSIL